MYFSRLKNVSKNTGVILQRFKSVSVMQSRFTGLIISSICEKKLNQLEKSLHCDEDASLPDTSSLQTVTFQCPAAPFDAAVPHRNIQARTWTKSRHRRCPCIGTNTQSRSRDFYLLRLIGTKQSLCMTSSNSGGLVHASRNQKIFSQ